MWPVKRERLLYMLSIEAVVEINPMAKIVQDLDPTVVKQHIP